MPLDKIDFREGIINTKEVKEYRKMCEELLSNDPNSVLQGFDDAKLMGFEQISDDLKHDELL